MKQMQVFGSFPLRISVMFLCIFSNLKVRSQSEDYDGQPRATIGTLAPLYASHGSIVSQGRKFELGFFSPGNSGNSYVGIWYYDSPETIVWIANREKPIREDSGSKLVIGEEGCLNLYIGLDGMMRIACGCIGSAELLDDGNFILISYDNEVVWQSFDHPTDTWLPGGELGILTSWKHHDDPAPGVYSFGMYPGGNPELLLWKNSSGQILWRSGVWNGSNFNSFSSSQANFSYIRKKQAKYFTYNVPASLTGRFAMTKEGQINLWVRAENQKWRLHVSILAEDCNRFGFCGPNGVCSTLSVPTCSCFKGFKIRSPKQWKSANWSGGCIRIRPLQCSNTEFFYFSNVSMPANAKSMNSESRKVCQYACLGNCSCNAYAYSDGKCSLWYGDLLNTVVGGRISLGNLYVRLENKKLSNALLAAFITIPVLICISLIYILWHIWRRRHNKKGKTGENLLNLNWDTSSQQNTDSNSITTSSLLGGEKKVPNLPQFSFSSISAATNNLSSKNKLGEGGFGPVYKGNLLGGRSVAVKRLSKGSGQGLEELRNETVLIAKLQHRNLVRLLGCCIDQDEKILIYEYMSNKSLDHFIFDSSKQSLLDWRRRVHIIDGIAQGLLYLHLHSRLRIVHRDLKASNILLDDELNPKIADFGMARIFGGNEVQANTNRIVGTYGYMSPEYAMEGLFSIKSDVFAFGVLLLEIISGKKNTGFRHSDCLTLLGHAWELWQSNRVLELVDSNLDIPSSFVPLRLIHVGLLCVQDSRADRPTMSDVLLMFSNEHSQLVPPKRPAFTSGGSSGFEIDKADNFSVNTLTASVMDGR